MVKRFGNSLRFRQTKKNSAPETLVPNIETDASGFAILSKYQTVTIASYVMKWLTTVYDSCDARFPSHTGNIGEGSRGLS